MGPRPVRPGVLGTRRAAKSAACCHTRHPHPPNPHLSAPARIATLRPRAAASPSQMHFKLDRAYKFEGIPDFRRHTLWPFISQAGFEGMATFTMHKKGNGMLDMSWFPEDVR